MARLKDYGKRDFPYTEKKERRNTKSNKERSKKPDSEKILFKERRKDFLESICLRFLNLCQKDWCKSLRRWPTPLEINSMEPDKQHEKKIESRKLVNGKKHKRFFIQKFGLLLSY